MNYKQALSALILLAVAPIASSAQESAPTQGPLAGHSMHSEAFNEGPRQHAYLMKGMGHVDFPVSTKSAQAQKFFTQGVVQLHGFWYFEAERSFRQAAAIDPSCAMFYWGMAMANVNNEKRAKGLIAEAVKRLPLAPPLLGAGGASPAKERMWIDALAKYYDDKDRKLADRRKQYTLDLEAIMKAYPDDLEPKAFWARQDWEAGIPSKEERERVDKVLGEIFAANPMHPAHHYRIHLWNYTDDKRALASAATGGQTAPGIAHLWHMPGHTFSALRQYDQAAWQQEASARVDHAQMMRDHVLPDQIHNYAHNNEWLIRDLMAIGRVHDAEELAMNMIELPRHPKYNTLGGSGSSNLGRQRLIDVLLKYELWDEAIRLSATPYLDPTELDAQRGARLHVLAIAQLSKGDASAGNATAGELDGVLSKMKETQKTEGDKAAEQARKEGKSEAQIADARSSGGAYMSYDIGRVDGWIAEVRVLQSLAAGDKDEARKRMEKASVPKERAARYWLRIGDTGKAVQLAKESADSAPNEVQPLAAYVEALQAAGQANEASAKFADLRKLAYQADLQTPVFDRLAPLARTIGLSTDWRLQPAPRTDVGVRPALDTLGPFRWQPMPAASWTLRDSTGKRVSLADYRGRPVVVFFFLGHGCAHCMEQLNLFAPAAREFKAAGIDMVAVSMDTADGLRKTFPAAGTSFPFPLVSDSRMGVFKAYRCYDDFEKMPLHGTFLVDGKGLVRWQDIDYEPFRDTKFLLAEAKRLLAQDTVQPAPRETRRAAAR